MAQRSSRAQARVVTTDEGARVTPVELFLDLIFVYGFTQVTAYMAGDMTWGGVVRGLSLLFALWWMWTGYAWLGNLVRADEGLMRVVLFVVAALLLVIGFTVPDAFANIHRGLWGPWVFASGYLVIMLIHNGLMLYVDRKLHRIRRNTLLLLIPTLISTTIFFIAGKQTGMTQTLLWASTVVITYIGVHLIHPEGWLLTAASHFAERHGLIILIALGESVLEIGGGVSALPISWELIGASVLGVALLATMWWAYFDVASIGGQTRLQGQSDVERPRLARDAYSYLHYPMIAAIILMALGLLKVFEQLTGSLHGLSLYALYGGVAIYLLALVGFRLRIVRTVNPARIVVAVGLVVLIPAASHLSSLGALLLLTVVMVGLILFEVVAFAPLRERVRHGGE